MTLKKKRTTLKIGLAIYSFWYHFIPHFQFYWPFRLCWKSFQINLSELFHVLSFERRVELRSSLVVRKATCSQVYKKNVQHPFSQKKFHSTQQKCHGEPLIVKTLEWPKNKGEMNEMKCKFPSVVLFLSLSGWDRRDKALFTKAMVQIICIFVLCTGYYQINKVLRLEKCNRIFSDVQLLQVKLSHVFLLLVL